MKNTIFLPVALLFTSQLCAQPFGDAATNFRIVKQQYANASGEIASTRFKYDEAGRLIKAFWTLDDKSRSSVNYYEYDSEGHLISAYREFSDTLTSFECFAYDSLGNKISERFYRSDGVTGSATYRYTNKGIEQAEFKNHKGWLNGTLTYTCNEKNKRESAVLMRGDKLICNVSYEYDEDHNLAKEYWDFRGQWFQSFTFNYRRIDRSKNYYSSPFLTWGNNYRISREKYTYNDELGGPSLYEYDEKGLLTQKVFLRSDSFTTTTRYTYDAQRKLVSSERETSDGKITRFSYTYDENNRLVQRIYTRADTLARMEAYLYNQDGDLIKAYIRNFDGWLTGTIDFDHDVLGTITAGQFTGADGFDALLTFRYNDTGLPVEILWEFTFGKFQRYRYEYEVTRTP
jgi:YD repeat-containing protein